MFLVMYHMMHLQYDWRYFDLQLATNCTYSSFVQLVRLIYGLVYVVNMKSCKGYHTGLQYPQHGRQSLCHYGTLGSQHYSSLEVSC